MLALINTRLAIGNQFRSCLQLCIKPISSRRTLLTPAFACDAVWRNRLSAPELSAAGSVSGVDLGNGLMRAIDRREPIAAVDIDVYANKLDSFDADYLPFFTMLWTRFRATQDCLAKLESTDHALVRCMMSLGQTDLLVQWLRDKFTYGLFLDPYSASLLIDRLMEAGNTKLAALVSFDHALQDTAHTDNPVCLGLMLAASAAHAAKELPVWCGGASEAGEQEAEAKEEEEEEDHPDTKHVITDYIRLPNYDGHFDLDEERLQVGHTLFAVSRRLLSDAKLQQQRPHQSQASLGLSCALIGLAALEKPGRILALLERPPTAGVATESAVAAADALLASARRLRDGQTEASRQGMRPLCRTDEVLAARAALKALPVVPDAGGRQWHEAAADFARSLVGEHEAACGQQLAGLYATFEAARLAELRRHGDWLRRRRLFQSAKSQLDSLVEEQETLTAFDNASEIRYAAWLAPRTRAELHQTVKNLWAADVASANRIIGSIKEASMRGGGGVTGAGADSVDASMLKRVSAGGIKDRFKPLKE